MATESTSRIVKALRWRIAALFIALSTCVYLALTALGLLVFHQMMLRSADHELRLFGATLGRAIDMHGQTPYFRDWIRTVETQPNRSIITIQLYDAFGHLLEAYGPKRLEKLTLDRQSVRWNGGDLRLLVTDLKKGGQVVGYMQLELSTEEVANATKQFGLTMMLTAPLVIAGLSITALVVSTQVASPFVQYMSMLRQFIADAGHELNTPLSILQARAESLAKKSAKQQIEPADFATMQSSLEQMGRIINDLMLLAEVEGPLSDRAPTAVVDLSALSDKVAGDFAEKFASKRIKLEVEASPASVMAHSDALQRLLSNLLENAWRYTESGGEVTLRVRTVEDDVVISVADTGIGIPAESLPRIFERFYRVDKSRSRASGGTGLGLSIVKAIAEAYNGHVSVESQLGAGTKFTVTLPGV